MKKLVLMIFVLLFVFSISGCKGGQKAGKVRIRYFRWADPAEVEATQELIKEFEKLHPDIEVKFEYAPWSEYWDKLQAQFVAGNAPDVFMISGRYFYDFARKGLLLDLTEFMDTSDIDTTDFFSIPYQLFTYHGKHYALPRDYNVIVLFYNKKLFDKAGLPYPDTTWDWNKLREIAKKLTIDFNNDGIKDQYGFLVQNDMELCWGDFVMQNGGSVLSEDRKRCTLDSPEAIEAIQFLLDFMLVDSSAPSSIQLTGQADPFLTGRVAMVTTGSWNFRYYDVPEVDYGITLLPRGKVRAAFSNGTGNSIYAKTKNKEAAWLLVRFFSSKHAQEVLARTGTSVPALKSVAYGDVYRAVCDSFGVDANVILESFKFAHPLPFTPQFGEWTDLITREFDKAWIGQVDAATACKNAAQGVNKILSQVGEW